MRTYCHLRYIAEFFLEWEYQNKYIGCFPCVVTFIRYVDKYQTARPATGDNIRLRRKDVLQMSDN